MKPIPPEHAEDIRAALTRALPYLDHAPHILDAAASFLVSGNAAPDPLWYEYGLNVGERRFIAREVAMMLNNIREFQYDGATLYQTWIRDVPYAIDHYEVYCAP